MNRIAPRVVAVALLTTTALAGSTIGTEDAIFTASDAAFGDIFGRSLDAEGDLLVVGAPGNDDAGGSSGSAYMFDLSTGTEIQKITASDQQFNDVFGQSVAISGPRFIVGSRNDNAGNGRTGSVYVFDSATGEELGKLLASNGASGDSFGESVALEGNMAAIGAPSAGNGAVYLFDISTGDELFEMRPVVSVGGQRLGESVAMHGDRVIAGAPDETFGGILDAGAAYLFDTTTGDMVGRFQSPVPAVRDLYGSAVDISDQYIAIAAVWDSEAGEKAGAVFIYDADSSNFIRKITPGDDEVLDYHAFGSSILLDGDTIVIGAQNLASVGSGPGIVYTYDIPSGDLLAEFVASDGAEFDALGASVALADGMLIAGANRRDSQRGAVYAFNYDSAPCPGDTDGSGAIDLADLNLVLANFGQDTGSGDTDGNGAVDLADLNIVLGAFGTACP